MWKAKKEVRKQKKREYWDSGPKGVVNGVYDRLVSILK